MRPFRLFSSISRSFSTKRKVTLFPGDGIGPEISSSVIQIFDALKVPIDWEVEKIDYEKKTIDGDIINSECLQRLKNNGFGLKGPFGTQIGKGYRSLNVTLRKKLNLYANVRPCKSIKGITTPYDGVDLVTIRENTEGEYSGLEHEVIPGVAENLKIISEKACKQIAKYAFDFAVENNRKKVTACHKAGIMKLGDGLFKRICKEISLDYPNIIYNEEQIDTVCFKLAKEPRNLDVMVMPNLYGDIVSDLCAGLIGGLGLTASGNIGSDVCLYEAVHGTAPDIAGKNLANPTALLLSAVMMLQKMGFKKEADNIQNAITELYGEGKYLTGDLGGKTTTTDFTKAVIDRLK